VDGLVPDEGGLKQIIFDDISSLKLQQVAAEIQEAVPDEKLQQAVAEIPFPALFGFIPWGHHRTEVGSLNLSNLLKKKQPNGLQ